MGCQLDRLCRRWHSCSRQTFLTAETWEALLTSSGQRPGGRCACCGTSSTASSGLSHPRSESSMPPSAARTPHPSSSFWAGRFYLLFSQERNLRLWLVHRSVSPQRLSFFHHLFFVAITCLTPLPESCCPPWVEVAVSQFMPLRVKLRGQRLVSVELPLGRAASARSSLILI